MSKPKIRFNGFTEDWEQRKLETISDVRDGTHDSPQYVQDGHPFITSKNVGNGFINYDDIQYVSNKDYEEINKRSKVDIHDILMGMIGIIGNLALIREKPDFAIKNVALIKYTGTINYKFLYHILQSSYVTNQLLRGMDGGTQKFIALNKIRGLDIPFPTEKEQHAIGVYFENLDHLITLHQRKCEQTKKLKKFMLQKMFPQNGKAVPEIRFNGFMEDWEQRKLGDVVQITMGQSPDGSTYSDMPSDYILVQGNADLEDGWVKPRVWTTQITKQADVGDLIMSVRAPAGAMGKTAYNAVIGRGVAAIKGNEFIYQLLVKMDKEGYWKKDSTGSTFESLNSESIKNAEIKLPSNEEQNIIGSYFKNLDHLITLHQRKCDELQNMKKFMLQNMFV